MIFRSCLLVLVFGTAVACSVTATRPLQEMADTDAAVRAAREVNAISLAPELFRQATEHHEQAKREYRLKNFHQAKALAQTSRDYAEKAEYEAIRAGGERAAIPEDPLTDESASEPEPNPEAATP